MESHFYVSWGAYDIGCNVHYKKTVCRNHFLLQNGIKVLADHGMFIGMLEILSPAAGDTIARMSRQYCMF